MPRMKIGPAQPDLDVEIARLRDLDLGGYAAVDIPSWDRRLRHCQPRPRPGFQVVGAPAWRTHTEVT